MFHMMLHGFQTKGMASGIAVAMPPLLGKLYLQDPRLHHDLHQKARTQYPKIAVANPWLAHPV